MRGGRSGLLRASQRATIFLGITAVAGVTFLVLGYHMFDIRKIVDVDDSNSVSAIQNRKLVTSENSTWQLQLSNKVSQVRVRSDDSMVYMLEFTMMDGSIKNGGYSSKASQPEAIFDIEPDDHIVRVEVNQGD